MLRSHCPSDMPRGYCPILKMAPLLSRIVLDLFARGWMDQYKELGRWQVGSTQVEVAGDIKKMAWEEAFQTPEMRAHALADSFLNLDDAEMGEGSPANDVEDRDDDDRSYDDRSSSYYSSPDDSSSSTVSSPVDTDESDNEDAVDPAFRNDGLNHCYLWCTNHERDTWTYVYVTLGTNLLLSDQNPPVTLYLNTDFKEDGVHTRRRYEPAIFCTVEEWEAYLTQVIDPCLLAAKAVIETEFGRMSGGETDVERA